MAADTTTHQRAPAAVVQQRGVHDESPVGAARSTSLLPRHLPALDGIRGLAVVAVVLFHLGHLGAPGGWLGVDVFFGLSGFLITALLLAEHERTGRISLRRFWQRRARRLAPALVLVLLVICALALVRDPEAQRHAVGRDTLWTLGYVVNWAQALPGDGYAVAPELRHLWSLGVEEQVYLIWPPILIALLRRPFTAKRIAWFAGIGTSASAVATLLMARHGASLDRLYYGSDTHMQTVLAGAVLAAALHTAGPVRRARWGHAAQLPGWIGAAALVYATLHVSSLDPKLYRGGFLVLALAVVAMLAAVALQPRGVLARMLSVAPIGWLGRRSYGIYLWHWPIICWLTELDTGLSRGRLAVVRILATLAAAELSHWAVEAPVRAKGIRALARPAQAFAAASVIGVVAGGVGLTLAY